MNKPTIQFFRGLAAGMAVALLVPAVQAQPKTYYKCVNAAGRVQFSDKPCEGAKAELPLPAEAGMAERKAENDAQVLRDREAADRLEAARIQADQAARAAQERHLQVDKGIASRYEQEREAKKATTSSVLPPTTLGNDGR